MNAIIMAANDIGTVPMSLIHILSFLDCLIKVNNVRFYRNFLLIKLNFIVFLQLKYQINRLIS